MIALSNLRQLRTIAMNVAVVACVLGMLGQVLIVFLGGALAGAGMAAVATGVAWCSLICVLVIFAAIFLIWVPSHDRIICLLRCKLSVGLLLKPLPIGYDFYSFDKDKDTPPPRDHIR